MIYTVLGCGVVIGLAMLHDSKDSLMLVKVVITIRGATWLVKKITEGLDKDKSEIINMTGWCLAGVSIIKLLANAKEGIQPVSEVIVKVGTGLGKAGTFLYNMSEWIEKLPIGLDH